MKAVVIKNRVEAALANRVADVFERHKMQPIEALPTGINEFDSRLPGFPRGAISEIHGPVSSGRISLLLSTLACATRQEESCVVIDCHDTFDLSSAAKAGVDFQRLLWIRCGHSLEHAFKAADLVLHGGGFGVVALNLVDVPAKALQRIISSWWFRFRRAIENTPTALIVLTPVAAVRSCAALVLDLQNQRTVWRSTLSLVSENGNGNFTDIREGSHLSLVSTPSAESNSHLELSHAQFLHGMEIRVNRERPIEWHPDQVKFHLRHT
jgi:hypothetical protein